MTPATTEQKWTSDQRSAITHGTGGLLVSAAAGSGKTSVLAERCVHVVCDGADPCHVHELLVVTFTEAAAAEMKGRIGRALADRHAAAPTEHTARQLAMLDRASISTLHGFCSRLLRQHFHLLGLDPNFRILDGDEATLLKQEVAAELFAQRYDAMDDAGKAFRALIDLYGDGNDQRLIAEVIGAHESLCSVVDPAGWSIDARARLAEVADRDLADTALGKRYLDDLRRELVGVQRECEAAGKFVKSLGGFDGYVAHLREMYAVTKHLLSVLDSHGLDALAEVANDVQVPRLKPVASTIPNKELAKERVDKVNRDVKEGPWRKRLAFTARQWRDGMAATLPHADTLLSLVEAFGRMYTAAKDDAGGLDFNDLERLALQVLSDGPDAPSAVARAYHAQFRHVMVDEFQDINQVQDAILTRVSRECLGRAGASNLFCVGDVKQSIYRFRLADPKQFLARRDRYADDPDAGRVIDLRQNFRSRGPLLVAVNAIFAKLMTRATADIDYDETHRLVPGATFPPPTHAASFAGSPIELHLMPKDVATASDEEAEDGEAADLDRSQREAVLVGHRILEIVGHRTVVDRDGTSRPATFGDCVVLLRSMRFKADTFSRQLRAMGVPVHSESNTGYFEATEVNDVLSLLQVLDNGRQDVPLAAVLRSPLANLPDPEDALARIRLAYPSGRDAIPFHAAVRRYAQERNDELAAKLTDLLDQLSRWRQLARDRPVAELLWSVYDETGYLAFCGGLPRGEQRQANLVELHDRARQFGEFRRQGLGRFLTFLGKLRAQSDLGQAAVASEAENVVRVMSIHRSKGLEFPVVFVPDLGKAFNVADLNGSILLDRDLGLGLRVVDEARQVRYASLAWTVVQQSLRQQVLAEELRVLYVALTRAKEHLVLIGTCDGPLAERWRQQWADHDGPLPAETVLAARTPLDWLGPTAASVGTGVFDLTAHAAEEVAAWSQEHAASPALSPEQAARARLDPIDPPPHRSAAATAVIDRIAHGYPHAAAARLQAARSVTDLVKHAPVGPSSVGPSSGGPPERVLDQPRFIVGEVPLHATDRGTATHVVLEHLDFADAATADAIRTQVERLTAGRRLTRQMADAVDIDAIGWLMSTDVGRLLRDRAADLRREVPVYFPQPGTGVGMDQIMVRGRVDLLVPDGDGWLIVDYKTDRVAGDALVRRADEYAGQLDLYRVAIGRITGQAITGAVLVFLHPRELRRV
jgi:ATP-dependent helicase/nuclease subunit A